MTLENVCACCGGLLSGARTSRWGMPFCWTECEYQFECQHRADLDAAVDTERVRRGLRPLGEVREAAE